MTIDNKKVTGQGQGNLNTVLGSIGTAGALLGGNGLLGGLLGTNRCGNNCGCSECSDNQPVTRYDANLLLALNAKDAEIANLKSDQYTDEKIVEATRYLDGKLNDLAAEVRVNKGAQNAVNMQQAVYNGTNTAMLQCLQGQVAQLMGLTKLVVPNSSVCPGWGEVKITPAAAGTAAA